MLNDCVSSGVFEGRCGNCAAVTSFQTRDAATPMTRSSIVFSLERRTDDQFLIRRRS